MTKQLTPLEALHSVDHWIQVEFAEQFKIIEKALKRLEEIDNRPFINGIREEMPADVICKKLKALEIIKKLNPYTIVGVQGQWYLMIGDIFVKAPKIPITEEQAILLKEVIKEYENR